MSVADGENGSVVSTLVGDTIEKFAIYAAIASGLRLDVRCQSQLAHCALS